MGKELSFTVENKKLKQRILELEKELANSNSNNVLLENKSKYGVKYKTILEGINDSAFVQPLQKEGYANFIEVNQVACKKLGYTREELLNMTVNNITTVSEAKLYSSHEIYKKLLTKKKVTFETIHIRKDGKKIDVEITASIFELDGKHIIMSVAKDITERKKQKKWLKKNEYILNETQKLSKIGGWEYRLHDKRVIWTDELFNIYGIPVGKIPIGDEGVKFYHKDYVESVNNAFNKCLETGEEYDLVARFINGKGHKMWVRTSGKPIWNNGEITKLVGNIADVTEQTEMAIKLKENEEKFSKAFYNNPVAMLLINVVTGKRVDVNKSYLNILGFSKEEFLSANPFKNSLWVNPEYVKNDIKQLIKDRIIIDSVIDVKTKSGKIVNLLGTGSMLDIGDGNLAIMSFVDITERKKNELEIVKLTNAIKQSPVSIVITNTAGDIEYVNPKFIKVTGYSFKEVINQNPQVLKYGLQKEDFYKELWDTISSGNDWKGEFQNKKKNGELYWESAIISPVKDKTGKITNYIAVKEDITEKKKMIEEIILSKEQAESASKMKSIFLAQMSHEIRTPINAMVSMASLLKYDFEENADEDQLMSFDILDRAGARIIRTVDLLLNLSEIQTGTYETTLEPVDIYSGILSSIVAENRKIAEKKNIKLSINSNTPETELIADSYTVNQIFVQLIENAIKYTKEGAVNIKIERNESEQLVVEVTDTGIGIDTEYLPKIFNPFTQEEMGYTRRFDGNGIGLTLVKEYCKLNNAIVEVESEKGVGSTFRVTFQK